MDPASNSLVMSLIFIDPIVLLVLILIWESNYKIDEGKFKLRNEF